MVLGDGSARWALRTAFVCLLMGVLSPERLEPCAASPLCSCRAAHMSCTAVPLHRFPGQFYKYLMSNTNKIFFNSRTLIITFAKMSKKDKNYSYFNEYPYQNVEHKKKSFSLIKNKLIKVILVAVNICVFIM